MVNFEATQNHRMYLTQIHLLSHSFVREIEKTHNLGELDCLAFNGMSFLIQKLRIVKHFKIDYNEAIRCSQRDNSFAMN